jgi:3-oxoacyl-[acyl-carrier-protein] synthase II
MGASGRRCSGGGAVPVLIAASAARSCFGDLDATFAALLAGECGVGDLRYADGDRLNVTQGYHIAEDGQEQPFRASRWLAGCVRDALAHAGVEPGRQRVAVVVGTGLRELRAVERWATGAGGFPVERLHFAGAVRETEPGIAEVVTLSNACSAGGSALALAQDMIELGVADAVVAAGTDTMTESMLAMVGRVTDTPVDRVRPFDIDRAGVLLGEGAAALVVVPEGSAPEPLARLLATGLSCDAHHETAPHRDGICRAMRDALTRARRSPAQVDLVLAHGTGTGLNDPTEASAIREVLAVAGPGPLVTAIKGAVGHTSGGSALLSAGIAVRCLQTGTVPPVVGLRTPLDEGLELRLVIGEPVQAHPRVVQVNAFGFGGVNAVTLLEAVA